MPLQSSLTKRKRKRYSLRTVLFMFLALLVVAFGGLLYLVHRTATTHSAQSLLSRQQQRLHELPKWIKDYVKWHNRMRTQFPGDKVGQLVDETSVLLSGLLKKTMLPSRFLSYPAIYRPQRTTYPHSHMSWLMWGVKRPVRSTAV